MITKERVKELLTYNKENGAFYWNVRIGCRSPGDKAGQPNSKGYTQIGIDGKKFLAHRLAWLIEYGRLPLDQIDHINRIRSDNRISNLRECDNKENCQNRSPRRSAAIL